MVEGKGDDEPLLKMSGIVKRFTGVVVLDGIDFDLRRGEVHVLFGENGAGKSTLINVIAGTFPPDGGHISFDGSTIGALTPHKARLAGISPVFQEFSLAPDLTVEENLFLGRELARPGMLNKRAMGQRARALLDELDLDLPLHGRVANLTRAEQQMTEIAKALLQDVKLLILDEPTASLTERETSKLFSLIEQVKAQGIGIIYVSHRMAEIKRLGDRITVLRDGCKVGTVEAAGVDENTLVEMMAGRPVNMMFPNVAHLPGETVLEGVNLTTEDSRLRDVSFHLRAGEIVGVAGLVGCGKSELARVVFGLEKLSGGHVNVFGERQNNPTPQHMLAHKLCYFPSDRVAEGLSLPRPVRENMSVAALDTPRFSRFGWLRRASERDEVRNLVDRLGVRPRNIELPVENLSGGNRQKVMLARGLTREIQVFLFDEPTVGIDVGAKAEIYQLLKKLAESGAAVLIVSSDLPEVLHLSNRIYVMHRGSIAAELEGAGATEEMVLSHFFDRPVDNAGVN